jgi:acyl-CoA synthetase (AMP-forming)/AMP-acid ligase II
LIHSNVDGLFSQVLIAEETEAEAGVGELCISSPAMFKEYWRKPEVSKSLHLSIWNS